MKRIFLLSTILLASSAIFFGQTKLTSEKHAFRPGDSHHFNLMKNVNEGLAGEDVIWDFTTLEKSDKDLTSHMYAPENIASEVKIDNSNFVLEEFGNLFYFNTSKDKMLQYGSVCGNTVTRYDKPFLKLKFPFSYGNKVTGYYSGTQTSAKSSVAINGQYEIYGDATGTLLLPNDVTIDNVLRVKQVRTIEYSNGTPIKEITYRWYAEEVRYPVLVIIKYVTQAQEYTAETALFANISTSKKSPTAVETPEFISTTKVFPNPCEEVINISCKLSTQQKLSVDLYDASGKFVKSIISKQKYSAGDVNLSLSTEGLGMKYGVYYLKIRNNESSYTHKIIKQ